MFLIKSLCVQWFIFKILVSCWYLEKRKRKAVITTGNIDDLSDFSEEDPYAASGDSDDFIVGSEESESDFEESQDLEDSEDVKTMLKEGKKFTKKWFN